MRLPFPEKIPLQYAVTFAALMAVVQLIQGTDPAFSLCFFLFVVITAVTFNLAGGLTRPSGGYVFFYSVLAVIAGVCWKVVMGEPADSNLTQPLLTMEAILGGMVSMCFAVLVSRRFRRKIPILPALTNERLLQASIGSLITGLVIESIILFVPHESGSALGALTQLNGFLPLAMILGVIYEIRRSGGTRSINIPVLVSGFTIFFIGVIGFSKQGMFTPLLCWAVAAASQRYRLAPYKLLLFMGFVIFTGYYLAPYSQYGRNSKVYATTDADPESGPPLTPMDAFLQNIDTSFSLLTQLEHVRQLDKQVEVPMRVEGMPAYYNTSQGMVDRLQMIAVDDAIINVTEQRGAFGPAPIIWSFENLVPHFLWPGKPELKLGNMYAHEIGMLDPDDTTTGISFSPIGEGFHLARWTSIFLILPLLWIALFILFDSLCGDIRTSPWGLLALVIFGHLAPEGGMNGVIYMLWFGAINISLAALAAVYVMPLLGYIATGSRESRSRRNVLVRSIARRLPAVQPSENASL